MVEIHQGIFDLANGGVTLVNLAAYEFARPRALAPCLIIEARYIGDVPGATSRCDC